MGQTLNRLDQITRSVADSTGMSQSQVANIAFGAAAHLGLSTAVAGGKLNATADKSYLSGLTAQEQKVLGSMTSEQLSEFKQFGDRVSRDSSFSTTVAADAREATEIASRLNASATRTNRAEAALAQRTSYSERLATALERGEVISIDVAQDPHNLAMFTRYAEQYGGTSAAAQALFEAELARRALGPNRTFTDGTGVPVTFGSLPPEHLRQSAIVDSTVDVASMRRDSDAAVRRTRGNPLPPTAPAESPEPRRDQMQAEATALRQRAGAQADQLGRNIDADRAEDGTLVPRRSLLKQSAKQVGKDAATTAESAVDAVKDLLKRK